MIRLLLLKCCLLLTLFTTANTIVVKNIEELNAANKKAQPGDIIILQNGEWKNVTIKLNCNGTKEQPITFKAQVAGKVMITGNSQLRLGGNFIIVEGFFFANGYAGKDPVINFRIDKDQLANNCRVTNCAISDFNNPKRMDENNWITFYGKKNSLDHCSFKDKKNMGVLLAVILDDERSRENFHSIDHNYFGRRPPLASNGGEIIRVGVSQHCEFNSNTQITNNFFEHCDGETEIVSIKSGSNSVKQNVFKECQGSVVLRHGDNNTVAGNFFLGNDKSGTGGVRVINKGQNVISNIFFKCRGVDFRSPLAIMNGIPNSPANRYVQVTDAEISDNTFYECSPITFCEGSDAERTLPPDKVIFSSNTFYNTRDSIIYRVYDDIKGFMFGSNRVSKEVKQVLINGFQKMILPKQSPIAKRTGTEPEYPHVDIIPLTEKETYLSSGATWFAKKEAVVLEKPVTVNCATTDDVYKQLERKESVNIRLTGKIYSLSEPFIITKTVQFSGDSKTPVTIKTENMLAVFVIGGNGNLSLQNLSINGANIKATYFISSDSTGSSNHYNLAIQNCTLKNLNRENGCSTIFYAHKSIIADSIVFSNNNFANNNCNGIIMSEEKDDKGYYNAEKISIRHNSFDSQTGILINVYRGGNDESTLGPDLLFSNNKIKNCTDKSPLITFTGVQVTKMFSNIFSNCNAGLPLIQYKDIVRARHSFENNSLTNSGTIEKNQFVTEKGNRIN